MCTNSAQTEPEVDMREAARSAAASQWALIAGLLIVVLGVASVPLANAVLYTPQRAVLAYLDALGDADAGRARGYLQAPDAANPSALSDAALEGAAALPAQARITSAQVEGASARVSASYVLGSKPHETTFEVIRTRPVWGLYSRWAIRIEQWPTLDLDVSGASAVDVGSATVAAEGGPPAVLFPVSYGIGFNEKYLRAQTKRVDVVSADDAARAALKPQPTEELRKRVDEIVRSQLDECAKQPTLMPAGCAFGYETNNDVLGKPQWTVVKYPKIELQSEGDELRVVPTTVGLRLTARMRDAVTAYISQTQEPVSAPLGASVRVVGDDVTVEQDTGESLGGS
ncbi:hypothetical protein BRM1_10750 [Brevibacterium sp. BRM-1]|uniref:hypothetical protein n=1 Tax=Brevibacterium sp. BRM-1 TaxID=2999062 RepID=UPI00227E7393|nr:hypothetical protein [Brevibacterium sp. BRM-1]WAL39726.1 hypothetical protein BRM1_10750 [Brevibacterium sp. BRM-1]